MFPVTDQEVQTANLDSPEVAQTLEQLGNRDTCPEELNFIDTPYTRDPKNVRNMYSDQKYRNVSWKKIVHDKKLIGLFLQF